MKNKIENVSAGDILAKDTYRHHSLVLKKNTKLTHQHIKSLKSFGIEEVYILIPMAPISEGPVNIESISEEKMNAKNEFFNCLKKLKVEKRYGRSFNSSRIYTLTESLFVKFSQNPTTNALLKQLKKHDYYTYLHSVDVFILGSLIATHLDLDNLEEFTLGCLLHDVGKLQVPSTILSKPSSLTDDEKTTIQRHPLDGSLLLSGYSSLVQNLANEHHEKLDGSGYPNKLTGQRIILEAQILSILDIYSALTSNRSYHKSFSVPLALEMMASNTNEINENYLMELCTLLEIYPLYSTVQLSSGVRAKVVDIDDKIPSFPVMLDTKKVIVHSLPMNREIWVDRIVKLPHKK
ncbi:HD domain-containing phosphohydrolase [Rossellomorea sp. RS05]|uniref:HD-GYP domain-containing protein n=1 Tax=Rossellomorea sp. RS05 TaxID=3149166 RepID=UPI00322217C9